MVHVAHCVPRTWTFDAWAERSVLRTIWKMQTDGTDPVIT